MAVCFGGKKLCQITSCHRRLEHWGDFGFTEWQLQVPPLRFASVGMTVRWGEVERLGSLLVGVSSAIRKFQICQELRVPEKSFRSRSLSYPTSPKEGDMGHAVLQIVGETIRNPLLKSQMRHPFWRRGEVWSPEFLSWCVH
jgi:hypothetical protein